MNLFNDPLVTPIFVILTLTPPLTTTLTNLYSYSRLAVVTVEYSRLAVVTVEYSRLAVVTVEYSRLAVVTV